MGQTVAHEKLNGNTTVMVRQLGVSYKSVWLTQRPYGTPPVTVTVPMDEIPTLITVLQSMYRQHKPEGS